MGKTTAEPEHKPEQPNWTEGNGDFDRLAVGLTVLVEMTWIYGQKCAPDHMTQEDDPITMNVSIQNSRRTGCWLRRFVRLLFHFGGAMPRLKPACLVDSHHTGVSLSVTSSIAGHLASKYGQLATMSESHRACRHRQ